MDELFESLDHSSTKGTGSAQPQSSHESAVQVGDQILKVFDGTSLRHCEESKDCGVPKPSKICTQCRRDLALEQFHSKGSRRDSKCKACVSVVKKTKHKKKCASAERIRRVVDLAVESLHIFESPSGRQVDVQQVVTVLRSALEEMNHD